MIINLNVVEEITVDNVYDFVHKFRLEEIFKKIYGCNIDKYNNDQSDDEIIDYLLENYMEANFLWYWEYHDEGNGYFTIFKVDAKKPIKISGKSPKEEVKFT